ncbi:MAG: glycosyltransferase family 2 protein [Acidimicrobiia bacterium]|nr:glycosyltransferase family 2 protein [Acidimicrobiia bacterium]
MTPGSATPGPAAPAPPVPPAPAPWAAVVVNHDAGGLLADCVGSLLADRSAGAPPDVVVVDNDSHDDSLSTLEGAYPEVAVIRPRANLGYARAANLGIAATRAPVVAVLNPDALLDEGSAARVLARFEADPRVAACGPRIRNPDGSTYPSARRIPTVADAVGHGIVGLFRPGNRFTRRYRELDADPAVARDVDWVSGAAVFLSRPALDAVGGWNERYFMYVEDVELCWRLRRAGWRVVYEPGAGAVHVQGVSTDRRPYRMIVEHHRSLFRFASQRWHGPRRALLPLAAAYLAVRATIAVAARAAGAGRGRPRVAG